MFKSDLNLIAVAGRPDIWYLGAPLIWDDGKNVITVPVGFLTDLASIPHVVDSLPDLDRTGLSRRPGALHDWLYGGERGRGKAFADGILLAALQAEGMNPVGALTIYEAVHVFGESSWDSDGAKTMAANFNTQADYLAFQSHLP